MRLILKQYISKGTAWQPRFVLEKFQSDCFLLRDAHEEVAVFPSAAAALKFARGLFGDAVTIEWEGTIY